MLCQPDIVHVGVRIIRFGHHDRIVPESEVVDPVRALCHRKEGLPVQALDTRYQDVSVSELHGTRIEDGVDSHPLEQERVRLAVQIEAPEVRRVICRQGRIAVTREDPMRLVDALVGAQDKFLVLLA